MRIHAWRPYRLEMIRDGLSYSIGRRRSKMSVQNGAAPTYIAKADIIFTLRLKP
jgi:hypothetical protein